MLAASRPTQPKHRYFSVMSYNCLQNFNCIFTVRLLFKQHSAPNSGVGSVLCIRIATEPFFCKCWKQCLLSMLTFEEKPVMIKAKKSGVGKCSYTAHFLGMHLPVITARRIRLQACNREERYINVQAIEKRRFRPPRRIFHCARNCADSRLHERCNCGGYQGRSLRVRPEGQRLSGNAVQHLSSASASG